MLFNMLYFVRLPIGQVEAKNYLPEVISACLKQALILNVENTWSKCFGEINSLL